MSFVKILLNDAFAKGTVEINDLRFPFPLEVFQLFFRFPAKIAFTLDKNMSVLFVFPAQNRLLR